MSNLIKQINSSDGTKSLDIYRLQESFLIIFYKNGLKVASFEHHYPAEFINHISYNFEFFEGYFFNGKPLENMDITECEIFTSSIPHTVNTSDKSESVGIGSSDGEALSFVLPVQNKVLKNVSFVRLEHDVIATWNAFACVAFYKFPIEYFSYFEDFKTWHKFIRFIEDKATDVSQSETIKHFVRSVLYPQNSLSCQDFDNINDALLCAMRSMPHRFNEFQAIQSKILSVFPYLPEYSDTVLDDDIPPCFKGA
jgi:hypothetical protein